MKQFYETYRDDDIVTPLVTQISWTIILCAAKDDEVVEFALSRSLSPTLVADYTLHLPDKRLLQKKLRELAELALEYEADGE